MPKALVAMANFKGTLSNEEATDLVSHALTDLGFTVLPFPIGDGGKGTAFALSKQVGGIFETVQNSSVLFYPNSKKPDWIYVESTETCGYHATRAHHESALEASSVKLGTLLKELFSRFPKSHFYIGLGDSAISDCGIGMLSGLGFSFEKPYVAPKITVLCDVLNPLCGPQGSAAIFAPQKGATPEEIIQIEQRMSNFADQIFKHTSRQVADLPMAGSAGGLGAAFYGALGAELKEGAPTLLQWTSFEKKLSDIELMITGEGKTDRQTLSGKAPLHVLKQAQKKEIQTVILSGMLGDGYQDLLEFENLRGIYACGKTPDPKTALFNKVIELFG